MIASQCGDLDAAPTFDVLTLQFNGFIGSGTDQAAT
jgi:hypothetical protein